MSFFSNPNRIPETYGLRIAAGLIGFFSYYEIGRPQSYCGIASSQPSYPCRWCLYGTKEIQANASGSAKLF